MANKNTKRIRAILRRDGEVAELVPTHGYHNSDKGVFTARRMEQIPYKHRPKRAPFPKNVNDNEEVTMAEQRRVFYGNSFIS